MFSANPLPLTFDTYLLLEESLVQLGNGLNNLLLLSTDIIILIIKSISADGIIAAHTSMKE